MTPALYNISIPQNATYKLDFQFKGSDGVPLNMTGYQVLAQLWTINKFKKLGQFTVTWVDRSIGKITLSLNTTDTANISTVGYWDLLVINPDGTKDYWVRGKTALAVGYTVNV